MRCRRPISASRRWVSRPLPSPRRGRLGPDLPGKSVVDPKSTGRNAVEPLPAAELVGTRALQRSFRSPPPSSRTAVPTPGMAAALTPGAGLLPALNASALFNFPFILMFNRFKLLICGTAALLGAITLSEAQIGSPTPALAAESQANQIHLSRAPGRPVCQGQR